MGQTLSAPATDKTTEEGADERFAYGSTEMQGWRISMEDAHATVLNLDQESAQKEKPPAERTSFFAVYDGHGGASVAKFAGRTVHKRLVEQEEYQQKEYRDALKLAFLRTDEALRADSAFKNDPSGCTAIACLVTPEGRIWAANAGDSRAVLCEAGRVKTLSYDHKPHGAEESARIRAAGGWVEYGRVNGNLALSRAIGDFEYKKNLNLAPEKQIVTSNPEIIDHQISEEDEFFVLACDGIWDCMSSQAVCDYVRRHAAQRMPLGKICESIVDYCMAPDADLEKSGVGCDNMTIIIVAILHGRTLEEWYDWIADRVERGHGYQTPTEFKPLYGPKRQYSWDFAQHPASRLAFDLRIPVYADDSSDEDMDDDSEDGQGLFGQHLEGEDKGKGKGKEKEGEGQPDPKGKGKEVLRTTFMGRRGGDWRSIFADAEAEPGASGEARDGEEEGEYESEESGEDALPPGFTKTRLTSIGKPLVSGPAELNLTPGEVKPEKQLEHTPEGDAPSGAVLVEGLLDKSEDPMTAL